MKTYCVTSDSDALYVQSTMQTGKKLPPTTVDGRNPAPPWVHEIL